MAIKKILLLGNPLLRAKCKPVKDCSSRSTRATIKNLRDTLRDFRARHHFGRGIAAPQIGSRAKIIFIGLGGLGALINPTIVKRSREKVELWDDCFSFPGILVKVKRYARIEVQYRSANGAKKILRAFGPLSELLQHEIDHLDGILAIDRAISSQHIAFRSEVPR